MSNLVTGWLGRLGVRSQKTMRQALDTAAKLIAKESTKCEDVDWASLDGHTAGSVKAKLSERYSAAYVRKVLTAIRGVVGSARRQGLIDAARFLDVQDALRSASADGVASSSRKMSNRDVRAMLDTCLGDIEAGREAVGIRDAAIIIVLALSKMTRAQVASAEVVGSQRSKRDLVKAYPVWRRSGETEFVKVRDSSLGLVLDEWLRLRREMFSGPLFTRVTRTGRVLASGLSAQAVYLIIVNRAKAAHVTTPGRTSALYSADRFMHSDYPHRFRKWLEARLQARLADSR